MIEMVHLNEKTLKDIASKTGRSEEELQAMMEKCKEKGQIMRFKIWVFDGRIES